MRILKYTLKVTDRQVLLLHFGAQILTVQSQWNEPVLWTLEDESSDLEEREIVIRGTGQPLQGDLGKYIATFQLSTGFVGHVFETTLSHNLHEGYTFISDRCSVPVFDNACAVG